jgi:hypothetical protein
MQLVLSLALRGTDAAGDVGARGRMNAGEARVGTVQEPETPDAYTL